MRFDRCQNIARLNQYWLAIDRKGPPRNRNGPLNFSALPQNQRDSREMNQHPMTDDVSETNRLRSVKLIGKFLSLQCMPDRLILHESASVCLLRFLRRI